MTSTIVPTLKYRDAPAAIDWLCLAFGFERHLVVPGPDDTIDHAELTLNGGMIMLGSAARSGWATRSRSGASNQGIRIALIEPGKPWQEAADERFDGRLRNEGRRVEGCRSRREAAVSIETRRRHDDPVRPRARRPYRTPFAFRYHACIDPAATRGQRVPRNAGRRSVQS